MGGIHRFKVLGLDVEVVATWLLDKRCYDVVVLAGGERSNLLDGWVFVDVLGVEGPRIDDGCVCIDGDRMGRVVEVLSPEGERRKLLNIE